MRLTGISVSSASHSRSYDIAQMAGQQWYARSVGPVVMTMIVERQWQFPAVVMNRIGVSGRVTDLRYLR